MSLAVFSNFNYMNSQHLFNKTLEEIKSRDEKRECIFAFFFKIQ